MWSKAISCIFLSSFWASFTSNFNHFIKCSLTQPSGWLSFGCFSILFCFLSQFLFLFGLFFFSSALWDPLFFCQSWVSSGFSFFIFLFKFGQEFLVFGFLFLYNFLLFAFCNHFKAFYHSLYLHIAWVLVSINGQEFVQAYVFLQLFTNGC